MTSEFFNSAVIAGAISCGWNQPCLTAIRTSGWTSIATFGALPGAVIQSVNQHRSGQAKTAPEFVREFDALFNGFWLEAPQRLLGFGAEPAKRVKPRLNQPLVENLYGTRPLRLPCMRHAVFISSLNGGAEYWCSGFRGHFSDVGLNDILLYVGGNIVVGKRFQEEVVGLLKGFGFDRVHHQLFEIRVAISQQR